MNAATLRSLCRLAISFFLSARAATALALPPYFFADFEGDGPWKLGPLPAKDSAVRLMQGKAEIGGAPEEHSQQVLALGPSENYPAVFVDASNFAKSRTVFCEILAKPFAVEESSDEEFLDFEGAIIGCFRVGSQGEIRGLYAKSPKENVWISTGIRFDLGADGLPKEWQRITIQLDRVPHIWSISINGVPAVSALRAVQLPTVSPLPLWLYGDSRHTSLFDDLLISTIPPDEWEKLLALSHRAGTSTPQRPGQQLVTQIKPTPELHRAQTSDSNPGTLAAPTPQMPFRGFKYTLDNGREKVGGGGELEAGKNKPELGTGLQPDYHKGWPLPAVVTLTADAELRPGVDLSHLRWRVAEAIRWPDGIGEIAGEGDFSSGLVQTLTIPGEWWERRALRIEVWVTEMKPGGVR